MRKKIIAGLLLLVVLGLVIGLPFAFNNEALLNATTPFVFYLIGKIVFGLGLIGVLVYGVFAGKERARGTLYPMVVLMLILQFVPLLFRAFIGLPTFQLGACIITLCICLAAMVVILGIMPGISEKQLASDEKFEASEIAVKKDLPDKF